MGAPDGANNEQIQTIEPIQLFVSMAEGNTDDSVER